MTLQKGQLPKQLQALLWRTATESLGPYIATMEPYIATMEPYLATMNLEPWTLAFQGGLSEEPPRRPGFARCGPFNLRAASPSPLGLRVSIRGVGAWATAKSLSINGLGGTAAPAGAGLGRGVIGGGRRAHSPQGTRGTWASDSLDGTGLGGTATPAGAGLGRGVVAGGRCKRSP